MKKMKSNNWKKVEYKVAKMLGGMRVPVSGRSETIKGDVAHKKYFIEVKSGKQIPKWVFKTYEKKKKEIEKKGYIVIKEKMPKTILKWWEGVVGGAGGKKPILVMKPRYAHNEFVIYKKDKEIRFTTLKKFVENEAKNII